MNSHYSETPLEPDDVYDPSTILMAQVNELCEQWPAIQTYYANHRSPYDGEAPTPRSPPFVNNTTPWSLYEEGPHPGYTVNPGDVCGPSAISAPPSIHDMMDERKPIDEYIGLLPASMFLASNILDSTPHPKPEVNRARPSSHNATTVPAPTRIKRSHRNPHDDREDVVDVNGDLQIVKQEREDGHHQCPFSRCDAVFTRAEDRNRHIKSKKHFNTLRARCPVPRCLFEGARPDTVLKHRRQNHGLDEVGKCTCGAWACRRARKRKD